MPRKKVTKKSSEKIAPKIAKGAAAVSVAAGVVAAGAALSDEETRGNLKEGAKGVVKTVKEVAGDFQESPQQGMQVVAHKVNKGTKRLKRGADKKVHSLRAHIP